MQGRSRKRCFGARNLTKAVFAVIWLVVGMAGTDPAVNPVGRAPHIVTNEFVFEDQSNHARHVSDEPHVVRGDKQDRVSAGAGKRQLAEVALGLRLGLRPQAVNAQRLAPFDVGDAKRPTKRMLFHSAEMDRLAGVPAKLADLVTNDGADILATAYAPTDPFHDPSSPFDALLGTKRKGRFVPPVVEGDHVWMKDPLPPKVFSSEEQKCLSTAIYFEARGESLKGQAAVAQVILNRVRNPTYPNEVCNVVYQNADWYKRCQFSFACDGLPERIVNRRAYRTAREVAMAVTGGKIFLREVGSSTHYNATYVNPEWADGMEEMTQIGSHIFYRTYNGGWS
ncbi:MAG: cell wall hydrolase [Phyllobacteriaceae bacterium]|uniref:cell wall hydrolase n=1 Tax=Nitratireductor alexandrii TaxID=2448161 RepID=UPI000C464C78|nr:cell wall hydrolase [Nitratireductor alexandrii]MAW86233.1 cell wall hydrolase [Phyllobacteriaceae bacterium]